GTIFGFALCTGRVRRQSADDLPALTMGISREAGRPLRWVLVVRTKVTHGGGDHIWIFCYRPHLPEQPRKGIPRSNVPIHFACFTSPLKFVFTVLCLASASLIAYSFHAEDHQK